MKKKNLKTNKGLMLVTLVAMIVAATAGIGAFNSYRHDKSIRNDKIRFAEANKKKQLVFGRLVEKLGTPLKTETQNICYNSEQGPFDNGRLWCQVASAAYFSSAIDDTKIKNYFADALESNGLSPKTAGDLWFDGARDLTCRLFIDNGSFAKSTPYYFSDDPNSEQTLVIQCVDRAKAKHYPYID